MTAPARRVLVRSMTERGLSERRALAIIGMSASALRYAPAPDRNGALRARIITLRHCRELTINLYRDRQSATRALARSVKEEYPWGGGCIHDHEFVDLSKPARRRRT